MTTFQTPSFAEQLKFVRKKVITLPTSYRQRMWKSGQQITCPFYENYISEPNADQTDWYIPLSGFPLAPGRPATEARIVRRAEENGIQWPQQHVELMHHALKPGPGTPTMRITNSGFLILTFEIDAVLPGIQPEPGIPHSAHIKSLYKQLMWLQSPKANTPLNCKIGEYHKHLCQFQDFRGIVVNWSGNKSIHYHHVFSTEHLSRELSRLANRAKGNFEAEFDDDYLGAVHAEAFAKLMDICFEFFCFVWPIDKALSSILQWKRLPLGRRTFAEGTRNIFGMQDAFQAVLFDSTMTRSPVCMGEDPPFLIDTQLVLAALEKPRTEYSSSTTIRTFDGDKVDNMDLSHLLPDLQIVLSEHWGCEWPKPVQFYVVDGEAEARLANSETDTTPASVMRDGFSSVLIQSRLGDERVLHTPFCLNEYVNAHLIDDRYMHNLQGAEKSFRLDTERRSYHRTKKDHQDFVRQKMNRFLPMLLRSSRLNAILSIQGIGKSEYFKRNAPSLIANRKGVFLFACRSHDQSITHRESFDRIHAGAHKGKVYFPFSFIAKELGTEVTDTMALEQGYPSLIHAVRDLDPETYEAAKQWRCDLEQGDFVFCTQPAARLWNHAKWSRAWSIKGFKDEYLDDPLFNLNEWLKGTEVAELVYDEFEWSDLLQVIHKDVGDMIKQLHRTDAWKNANNRIECYQAYMTMPKSFRDKVAFNDCHIDSSKLKDAITVDRGFTAFGPDNSILYRNTRPLDNSDPKGPQVAAEDYVIEQSWWHMMGDCRITLLTTQEVSIRLAGSLGFKTRKLLPKMDNVVVACVTDDEVTEKGTANVIDRMTEHDHEMRFIGNFTKDHPRGLSFDKAKGSNDLANYNICTLLHWLSPAAFQTLNVIGQKYDIPDIIQIAYLDNLYQSIARNQGFRQTDKKHLALMPPGLFANLAPTRRNQFGYVLVLIKESEIADFLSLPHACEDSIFQSLPHTVVN